MGYKLTDREKIFLLQIVRESIRMWLSAHSFRHEPDIQNIISIDRPVVLENFGAYITLYKDDKKIASKGKLSSNYPLYLVVRDLSLDCITNPPQIGFNELNDIKIVISVITPLKKIISIEEIIFGENGVYVKNDKNEIFLPNEIPTKEEITTQLEIGSEIFVFDTISFNEKQYGLI